MPTISIYARLDGSPEQREHQLSIKAPSDISYELTRHSQGEARILQTGSLKPCEVSVSEGNHNSAFLDHVPNHREHPAFKKRMQRRIENAATPARHPERSEGSRAVPRALISNSRAAPYALISNSRAAPARYASTESPYSVAHPSIASIEHFKKPPMRYSQGEARIFQTGSLKPCEVSVSEGNHNSAFLDHVPNHHEHPAFKG